MPKRLLLFIFLLSAGFVSAGIMAQAAQTDSLANLLQNHTHEDTIRVNLLNDISVQLLNTANDNVLLYSNEAIAISQNIGFEKGIAVSLRTIALFYYYKPDYNKAIEYFKKALMKARGIDEKKLMARNLKSMAGTYIHQAYYLKAMQCLDEALEISEEIQDEQLIAECFTNMGIISHEQNEYAKALEYYTKALKINKLTDDIKRTARNYMQIGSAYLLLKNYDQALGNYKTALNMCLEIDYARGIASCLSNTAIVYSDQGNLDKALEYNHKALKIAEENAYRRSTNILYINMADIYLKRKNYTKALYFTAKSTEIANELNLLDYKKETYLINSKIFAALNDHQNAYKNHLLYKELNDSIFNILKIRKIKGLELQYEYEKDNLVNELEQQKRDALYDKEIELHKTSVNIFIFISAIIALITIFVVYSLVRKRKANIILAKQKDEIQIKNNKISEQNNRLFEKNNDLTNTLAQLEETRMQLLQSEKMASIGVLTAGIAHEINNPVNFIQGGVNSLLRDFEDIEKVIAEGRKIDIEEYGLQEKLIRFKELREEYNFNEALKSIPEMLHDIKLGVERTTAIVKSLGSFVRSDNDNLRLFNIHESIETSLVLLRSKYKDNIEIIKDFDGDIPKIRCNVGKVNQIFLNIISNAIDAIPGKGEIFITTRILDDKISISIKDTGVGISKELQTKIFDPFYTSKAEGKGMGLGLYIAYGFVQEHNGTINVISKLGEGSEFIVHLPRA